MSYPITVSEKIQKLRQYQYEASTRNEVREHLTKALEALDYDTPELLMLITQLGIEIKAIPMIKENTV